MRSDERQPDEDELGPVDFLAVEFPGGHITAPGFEQLLSLARQGTTDRNERLAQLSKLGDLKNAGVLTEAEFEREKARILNG
jgi:hypothetical protein